MNPEDRIAELDKRIPDETLRRIILHSEEMRALRNRVAHFCETKQADPSKLSEAVEIASRIEALLEQTQNLDVRAHVKDLLVLLASALSRKLLEQGAAMPANVDRVVDRIAGSIRESRGIVKPPGFSLARFAEFFLSPKTVERIVNPLLADLQSEYFAALDQRRKIKAIWIRLSYSWAFFKALGFHTLLKAVVEVWRAAAR